MCVNSHFNNKIDRHPLSHEKRQVISSLELARTSFEVSNRMLASPANGAEIVKVGH
jgi:hypothetical protein